MSIKEADIWLENARDKFHVALDNQNYVLAADIIIRLKEIGFTKEATTLAFMLRNVEFKN